MMGISERPHPNRCKRCECCAEYLSPTKTKKGTSYWGRQGQCRRCGIARTRHGFDSHKEYDMYLTQGCWITGCENLAVQVDHDHKIHPQDGHSCNICRRGPICRKHNVILKSTVSVRELRQRRDNHSRAAESYALIVEALEQQCQF